MRHQRSRPISEHRLARLIAWLGALLAWLALGACTQERHRHRNVGVGKLRHAVRAIIIVRAAALFTQRLNRFIRPGVPLSTRARGRRASQRAIAGAWLRRRLIARGGFIAQVTHLLNALRDWRALGAALARHRRFGLTQLNALTPARTPATPLVDAAAPAICAADTS